jgi:hypothetical protein
MSSEKQSFIRNPKTGRPIKVGGPMYLKLVKQGLIENEYTDPHELGDISPDETDELLQEKIKEINEKLPMGKHCVRGRGKYKGKLVQRNQKPKTEEIVDYTTKVASKVVNENLDQLADCEDIERELERLIMEELASVEQISKSLKQLPGVKKKTKFVIKEHEDDSSEESSGDSEESSDESSCEY